eukprot:g939.t1
MDDNLVLFDDGVVVALVADTEKPFEFVGLELKHGQTTVHLTFSERVSVAQDIYETIVDRTAAPPRLKRLAEIAKSPDTSDVVAKRLARFREALAYQKLEVSAGADAFFGLPGSSNLKANIRLSLPFLSLEGGDRKAELRAEATLELGADVNLGGVATASVNASARFSVHLKAGLPQAGFSFGVPEVPAIGWDLPKIAFDNLSFDNLQLPVFQPVSLPFPDWLDVSVRWSNPAASIKVVDGKVQFIVPSTQVTILASGQPLLEINNFAVLHENGKTKISGDVSGSVAIDINKTFVLGGGQFPLRAEITIENAETKIGGGGNDVTISWTISRLAIEASGDPNTRIALKLTLETSAKNGELDCKVLSLDLLDLGGNIKIRLPKLPTGSTDGLLPVITLFENTTDELKEFFVRVGKLIARLSAYAAETAGEVAGYLSELAEQAGSLIADGIAALAEASSGVGGGFVVEIRLDAGTLRPVQVIVSARSAAEGPFELGGSVLSIAGNLSATPAVVVDLRSGWYGLLLLHDPADDTEFTLSTNLWFEPSSAPTSGIGSLEKDNRTPLLSLKGTVKSDKEIVLAAIRNGKPLFFQSFDTSRAPDIEVTDGLNVRTVSKLGNLGDLTLGLGDDKDIKLEFDYSGLQDKIVSVLPKGPDAGGLPSSLSQHVMLKASAKDVSFKDGTAGIPVTAFIKVLDFEVEAVLNLQLRLNTLQITLDGDKAYVTSENPLTKEAFGLTLKFTPGAEDRILQLAFEGGDFRLEKVEDAKLEVIYDRLASRGEGLVLTASRFGIGRGGLDLEAHTSDTPVRLAGLEQPFRFSSGSLTIEGGKLVGGTLSGAGPLPPALVGEAVAEIDLVFGARDNRFTVVSANAKLEKEGEPLYSTGTRFRVSIDALGLDYREVASGGQHFFFLLWGEAAFEPGQGEFEEGLFKNIRTVSLKLEAAPLTGDARELLRHIEFQVEIDPPVRESLFDTFSFELRGIGFHPASDLWPDRPPAIGLSGEVAFLPSGSAVRAEIDVHTLWLTTPDSESGSPLPRVRADGLSVLVSVGGIARVEATAVAVDGNLPTLYAPETLPADVTADGFLASGRVDITGLGAYGGAMGFLELSKENTQRKKTAMFLYLQAEKLAERIDTPIGPLWIREAGAGIGKNFTLAGIAEADKAKTPREMVRALDKVSKRQGNLASFTAWTPQYEPDALTLALRGMISITSASPNSSSYNASGEKNLSNPLLLDIVLAVRSDLTFFVNARGWLATNYNDWFEARGGESWKERPSLRGYLYFSVPRKELLARFLADPSGVIGKHPELPGPLIKALTSVRYSSTLYIRPGLYHMEFGWPYELGFDLGDRNGKFWLSVSGGMVFRIEDATALYGIAFRATGGFRFEGRVGGSSFGASVAARSDFAIGARFIAFLAPLEPRDTLFYGEIYLNLTLSFGVSIWLSFKIFRKRITLRIGFSISLTISIAAELVVAGTGIGARIHAAVGVRGFGRSLMVGVGFSFNDGQLERARARVARFMQLGLGIDPPRGETLYAPAPTPEPSRQNRAVQGDAQLDRPAPPPIPEPPEPDDVPTERPTGERIGHSDFWALLFSAGKDNNSERYLLQLIPKDSSAGGTAPSTFFVEPFEVTGTDTFEGREDHADYQLVSEGALPSQRLVGETPESLIKPEAINATLDRKVGEALILNTLLADCFLASKEEGQDHFGEPRRINYEDPLAAQARPAREAVADQAERFRAHDNAPDISASLDVEERRSTLITLIGESAFDLAERLRAPGKDDWRRSGTGLEARDFGLTFVIDKSEIDTLFPKKPDGSRPGVFKIRKRIRINDNGKWKWGFSEAGSVDLLRHPSDSFDEQEPRLEQARVEAGDEGLKLCWDLEPAFGRSGATSFGFVDDPETHLAYYEIERSFEGTDVSWNHSFRTRTATPCNYKIDAQTKSVTIARRRADLHLADDLSQGGIPEDFRALILGVPIPSGTPAGEVWKSAVLGTRTVSIVYKVTAVDQMGTRTTQRVLEYELKQPHIPATAPVKAELSVNYDAGQPGLGFDNDPNLALALVFADEKARQPAREARYRLRIRRAALKGGGQYGSDAVDDAKSRPGQQEIASKHPDPDVDIDLLLVRHEDGTLPIAFLTSSELAEEREPDSLAFRIETNGQDGADALSALRKALGLTSDQPDELRAARVFVQRIASDDEPENDSAWVTAETQLTVAEAPVAPTSVETPKASPFSATVELLEKPVKLDFPALHRKQLRRKAGRLELLFPTADGALRDLLPDEVQGAPKELPIDQNAEPKPRRTDAIVRRLDPDRRSAIRLEMNVLGASLKGAVSRPEDLAPLIGGFDIFHADPARLRVLSVENLSDEIVAREAQRRATIKVLPRSLSGIFPDKVTDFQTLEARYPSDTRRCAPKPLQEVEATAESVSPLRRPWYSRSESLAVFPAARLRRSLLPTPDETMISALLDNRKVTEINISMQAPSELAEDKLEVSQSIVSAGFDPNGNDIPGVTVAVDKNKLTVTPAAPSETGIASAELRAVLRDRLVLGDGPTGLQAADRRFTDWRRKGSDASLREGFSVELVLEVKYGAQASTSEKTTIDLISPHHPVLDEVLGALVYETFGPHPGKIYRAYEVVLEPQPQVKAATFDAFVNATGSGSDPYGWSALRSLGLAAGFRLYDIDNDRYLSGKNLLSRVHAAFDRAIQRYVPSASLAQPMTSAMDAPGNIGAPFVELVDMPEAYMGISSFDGRDPNTGIEDSRRVLNGNTSILQIALRPRPAQQLHLSGPGAPVRYFVVKKAPEATKPTLPGELEPEADKPKEPSKLVPKAGFVLDLQLLASVASETAPQRCTDTNTGTWLFGKGLLPGIVPIEACVLERVAAAEAETPVAIIRATNTGDADWKHQIDEIKTAFANLVTVQAVTHPGQPDTDFAFSLFAPLPGPVAAALQIQSTGGQGRLRPFDTLLNHLPPGLVPEAIDWGKPGAEAPVNRAKAVARALQHVDWTERFFMHGSGQTRADDETSGHPTPSFALVSLMSEDALARAPDANGVVSAFFIDPTQNGRELYFAARPFGRYAAIEAQTHHGSERQPTLFDGFGSGGWQDHFVALSLPRTRPLQKPAILSAARPDPDGPHPDEIELIVARTPDQIIGTANIPAERALQPGWTGIELRAAYPAEAMAKMLVESGEDFDWTSDFFDPATGTPVALTEAESQGRKIVGEVLAEKGLEDLRNRAPDAWRGAIRYGFPGLPHFLALTALAHQSAGVVVSDVSAATLPEAAHILRFPPFRKDINDQDPRLGKNWGKAEAGSWAIARTPEEANERLLLTFDLPLARNLDLMTDPALWSWTGGKAERVPPVFRLPDAGTSYRITAMSADLSASAPQIEVLPGEKEAAPLYQLLASGDRLSAPDDAQVTGRDAQGNTTNNSDSAWNWRLGLTAHAGTDAEPDDYTPDAEAEKAAIQLAGREAPLPDDFDAALWARWAPRREATIEVAAPDQDKEEDWQAEVNAFRASLDAFKGDPAVSSLMEMLRTLRPEDGGTAAAKWTGELPLALGASPPGPKVTKPKEGAFKALVTTTQGSPFAAPDPSGRIKLWHLFRAVYPVADTAEGALLREQRFRWLAENPMPFGGYGSFDPRYTPWKADVPDLPAPFVSFELRRYKWTGDGDGPSPQHIKDFAALLVAAGLNKDITTSNRALDSLAEIMALQPDDLEMIDGFELPVAAGVEAVESDDFAETRNTSWHLGYHKPPSTEELSALTVAELSNHLGSLVTSQAGSTGLCAFAQERVSDVLLATFEPWVDPHMTSSGGQNIVPPNLRLAAGSIALRIDPRSQMAKFLHYHADDHSVFFGQKLIDSGDASGKGPLVWLTHEGIEIHVGMPNPLVDMDSTQPRSIDAWIRIEPGRGPEDFVARLVGPASRLEEINHELFQSFNALEALEAPLRAVVDRSPGKATFTWRLFLDKTGLHLKPQGNPGDDRDWVIDFEPELLQVRLETETGLNSDRPAVARLETPGGAGLSLTRHRDGNGSTTLEYRVEAEDAGLLGAPSINVTYEKTEVEAVPGVTKTAYRLDSVKATKLPSYLPLTETIGQRQKTENTQSDSFINLMVRQGTLQLSPEPQEKPEISNQQPRDAFVGNCIFRAENPNAGSEVTAVLEIDAARSTKVSVTWISGVVGAVSLAFGDPRGGLRSALWSAEEQPGPNHLLPTGRRDPAQSRELTTVFGGLNSANCLLSLGYGGATINLNGDDETVTSISGGLGWVLEVDEQATRNEVAPILWSAFSGLPLISAMPMLSDGGDDAEPSSQRGLFPRPLKSGFTLFSDGNSGLPELCISDGDQKHNPFKWPWPDTGSSQWSIPAVPLVSPTAPGLEYVPAHDGLRIAMRYDLPILDELFAGARLPETAEENTGDNAAKPSNPKLPSVYDPDAIVALWRDRRRIDLALTRTQNARATAWATEIDDTGVSDDVPGPLKLAEPYDVAALVSFDAAYTIDAKTLPLGSYRINGMRYAGDTALLGLTGPLQLRENLLHLEGQGDVEVNVKGFAPALYPGWTGLLADSRGTGMADHAEANNGNSVERETVFQDKAADSNPRRHRLHSLTKPVPLLLDDNEVAKNPCFWVRDLPLDPEVDDATPAFEAHAQGGVPSPIEGYKGPSTVPFNRGNTSLSIYEWRVEEPDRGDAPKSFGFDFGLLHYRPIRLLSYNPVPLKPGPGGEKRPDLSLLCHAGLARRGRTEVRDDNWTGPFSDDRPYETGALVRLDFDYDPNARLRLRTVTSVKLDHTSPTLKIEPAIKEKITLPLSCSTVVSIAGRTVSQPHWDRSARLSGTIEPDGQLSQLQLKFALFQEVLEVPLQAQTGAADKADGFVFDRSLQNSTKDRRDGVTIEKAVLALDSRDETRASLCLELALHQPLHDEPESPAVISASADTFAWFGALLPQGRHRKLEINPDKPALHLSDARQIPADANLQLTPIKGLELDLSETDKFDVSLTCVLGAYDLKTWKWRIDSVLAHGKMSGTVGNRKVTLASQTHKSVATNSKIDSRLLLSATTADEAAFSTSAVSWDPDGVHISEPGGGDVQPDETHHVEVSTKASGNAYCHKVRATLEAQPITPEALSFKDGQVVLSRPVPILLNVTHSLSLQAAPDRPLYDWRVLEPVVLCTTASWLNDFCVRKKGEFPAGATFGPRSKRKNGNYHFRGDNIDKLLFAGIGPRQEMLSGFDDERLIADLKPNNDLWMLIGGGPSLQVAANQQATLFSLPWVVAFSKPEPNSLPSAFQKLMVFQTGTERRWRATRFDGTALTLAMRTLPAVTPMPATAQGNPEIEAYFTAAAEKRRGRTGSPSVTRMARRAVEQVFFEPHPDMPQQANGVAEWPFFLASLVGLKAALAAAAENEGDIGPIFGLHPWVADTGEEGLLVTETREPFLPDSRATVRTGNPGLPIGVVTLARNKAPVYRLLETQEAARTVRSAADVIGPRRLRELAERLQVDPAAAAVIEIQPARPANPGTGSVGTTETGGQTVTAADTFQTGLGIALAPDIGDFGVAQNELSDPASEISPSPALGWPDMRGVKTSVGFAMAGHDDQPVISEEAGLAARSAALSLSPTLFRRNAGARYVATQARALFHHGDGEKPLHLPAPPALHLSPLPPRLRTPLRAKRNEALKQAGAALVDCSAGLLPPGIGRSLIGERPGILETVTDAVLADSDSRDLGLDPENDGFGRAGVLSPVLQRQLRTPRSPRLPIEKKLDLATRRRTYLSRADQALENDQDPAAKLSVRPHPAAMWREVTSEQALMPDNPAADASLDKTQVLQMEERFILELVDDILTETKLSGALAQAERAKLSLSLHHRRWVAFDNDTELIVTPSMAETVAALAKSGLLAPVSDASDKTLLQAWIEVEGSTFQADRISWSDGGECDRDRVLNIDLSFASAETEALLQMLDNPDPSTKSFVHFTFHSGQSDSPGNAQLILSQPTELQKGKPRNIRLPIGRQPRNRPSLDVHAPSFLFADPAYDRVLTTPAGASQLVQNGDDDWLLATDRVAYDLSGTMFLAFGRIDSGTGSFTAGTRKGDLKFAFFRKSDDTGQSIPLKFSGIPQGEHGYAVEEYKEFAIPIGKLVPESEKLPRLEPGDTLILTVVTKTDKIELRLPLSIAKVVKDPAPAAVYSVVQLDKPGDAYVAPRVLLHKASPAPSRMEFPSLLEDLASGHVRRRAIFEWHSADVSFPGAPERVATLIKTDRYRKGEVGFQDITALVGAIGGAAVTALFKPDGALFAPYGIGLATGFFAYFLVLVILVRASDNFDSDWFLDGRRKKPMDPFEIPDGVRPTVAPMSLRQHSEDTATIQPGYLATPTAAIQVPIEVQPLIQGLPAGAPHLPARPATIVQETLARAESADDIIASCKTLWAANKKACNDFVIAVAKDHGVILKDQADDILKTIQGTGWTREADGKAAAKAAKEGKLVVGGLPAKDLGDDHGHVVIVVDGSPEHGKYPKAYWGSLNEAIREDGGKGIGVNWCFAKAVRDKVILVKGRAALLVGSHWGAKRRLSISFIGGSRAVRQRVAEIAVDWTRSGADLSFDFRVAEDVDPASADIRVSFVQDGRSWSVLGNMARNVPRIQATINIGWLTETLPQAEARSVILHEFGHALELIHEHQNPHQPVQWDVAEVVRNLRGHFNVKNGGIIKNLPDDYVITPPVSSTASVSVQRMSVEAAMTGNVELLKQAVLHDPLVGAICTPEEVWQMVDELLVAQAEWLPQFAEAIPAAKDRLRNPKVKTQDWSGAARQEVRSVERMRVERSTLGMKEDLDEGHDLGTKMMG